MKMLLSIGMEFDDLDCLYATCLMLRKNLEWANKQSGDVFMYTNSRMFYSEDNRGSVVSINSARVMEMQQQRYKADS